MAMSMRRLRGWLGHLRHPRRTAFRLERAREVFSGRAELAYAQHGEDGVLAGLFEGEPPGFYVDVGAHHPTRLSNTANLYRAGWHGLDVDARPGTARLFQQYRPRDKALEVGVGGKAGTLPFFIFADDALNTFSADWAKMQAETNGRKIVRVVDVPVMTLAELLNAYVPASQRIDLMSVDVEGLDLEVLQSNDWERFRPRVVVAEDFGIPTLDRIGESPIVQFLGSKGYVPVAKTTVSVFFRSTQT